jgi:hypothetical protein
MRKLNSLEEVNASALPATVLALLSAYANVLRKHNGLILKLSSMNVFRHVYNTSLVARHPDVHTAYDVLLKEVRGHVYNGTMYTNDHKRFKNLRMARPRPPAAKAIATQALLKKSNLARKANREHRFLLVGADVEPNISAFG